MRSSFLAIALMAMPLAAQAEGFYVKPIAHIGITVGGESVADEIKYTNGKGASPNAGGMYQLGGGAEFGSTNSPFSLVATVNYHWTREEQNNGDTTFTRIPVEVLGFYRFANQYKVGLGLRYCTGVEVEDDTNDARASYEFKDSLGVVVEGAYEVDEHWTAVLRLVGEEFEGDTVHYQGQEYDDGDRTVSGSHAGLYLRYRF